MNSSDMYNLTYPLEHLVGQIYMVDSFVYGIYKGNDKIVSLINHLESQT
jgi:hypothetical protein